MHGPTSPVQRRTTPTPLPFVVVCAVAVPQCGGEAHTLAQSRTPPRLTPLLLATLRHATPRQHDLDAGDIFVLEPEDLDEMGITNPQVKTELLEILSQARQKKEEALPFLLQNQ